MANTASIPELELSFDEVSRRYPSQVADILATKSRGKSLHKNTPPYEMTWEYVISNEMAYSQMLRGTELPPKKENWMNSPVEMRALIYLENMEVFIRGKVGGWNKRIAVNKYPVSPEIIAFVKKYIVDEEEKRKAVVDRGISIGALLRLLD